MSKVYDLTTEKLRRAVGIDVWCPRFAWKIDSDKEKISQVSYEICLYNSNQDSVWETGTVNSCETESLYDGAKLEYAEDYTWILTSTLSDGSKLFGKAFFTTGLMDAADNLDAKWITLPRKKPYTKESIPAFRKEFALDDEIASVKLFISGSGVYEGFINGKRIYDKDPNGEKRYFELKPGFTEPLRRRFYHTYDVTELCKKGKNCISAIAGRGWWSDEIGRRGDFQTIYVVIVAKYKDGNKEIIVSDKSWKVSTEAPLTDASIWDGENYDARISTSFMKAGFKDAKWENANESDFFTGELESMHGEPIVERKDRLRKPVEIYTFKGAKGAKPASAPDAKDGEFGIIKCVKKFEGHEFTLKKGETAVVDFAQNGAGWEWFVVNGKAGTEITIRHGEMKNDNNGERSRGNDGPAGSVYVENLRSAKATTKYIIGEDDKDEEFEPIYTFYGFRYVQITSTGDVTFKNIAAKTITSVGFDSGKLETGDKLVNKLENNGRWGMYSNYVSIPTDCPQRNERLGWTADTQVFTTTAQYYSTAAQSFLEKWMQDMRDSQDKDGAYPSVAPLGPWVLGMGCMGWADAGILVPYYVWRMSEDPTIIDESWFSMKLYMDDFLARRSPQGPLLCYGDWLSFEPNDEPLQKLLSVCYYAWDAMLMSEMADVLGKEDDKARYLEIYENEKRYFIEQYVNDNGTIKIPQQTASLFALKLKLLPDEKSYEAVKNQLVENFKATGYRLQTGFLGTSILLPTLSECGLNELAYTLLLQDQMPSWLYSVNAGATTIWERWNSYSIENGFGDVGMNSFNHYAYGCVSEWMYGYMAGIRPTKYGFRNFTLAPVVDKRIGYCRAEYDSVCGLIKSSWKFDGDKLTYECTIPANTTATLTLPITGEVVELGSGKYKYVLSTKQKAQSKKQ